MLDMVLHYNPDWSQKVGIFTGGVLGMIYTEFVHTVTSAAIGAAVAFVVTTALRYLWEKVKKRYKIGENNLK
jgi:hypothetical protein